MFEHIVVKNLRCFSGLHLKGLGRVNLIAGKNNTGKTALLEAIHLHNNPGDWQLPIDINKVRGIEEPREDMVDVCGWLFYHKHAELGLEVASWDDKGVSRTLTISILDPVTSRERYADADKALLGIAVGSRLILKYEQTNQPEQISIGAVANQPGRGFIGVGARIPWSMASVFLTSSVPSTNKDVDFFGEVEVAKRQHEILPALQVVEPRLQKLALAPLAGQSVIHGDIGLPRLVPVPFIGEGMRRLLSIMLAIANAPGGVVLIDEFENGIHHSVLKSVWQAVADAARRADVQVFATTHSYECISAANEAFQASGPYDLRLHRLARVKEEIRVGTYDQETLGTAMEHFMEVR